MEDCFQDQETSLRVDGHAFWHLQCTQFFHALNERVLRPFQNKFIVVYLDDILVYSKSQDEHLLHLRNLFKIQRNEKLYGKLEKCMFLSIRITLHSYIVVGDELRVAPKKVPKNVHEV